jgi:hypothetical protein
MHYHEPRDLVIGPITIHVSSFLQNEKRTYPNLPSAVWNWGTHNLKFSVNTSYVVDEYGCLGPRYKIWFYDGCGDLISPLVVRQVAEKIRASRIKRRSWSKEHVSEDHFRRYPVPNIRKSRSRRGWDRHMRTAQELRMNLAVTEEENDLGVRIRGRRCNLPTYYDDVAHARRGDNWKNYRKTRWK